MNIGMGDIFGLGQGDSTQVVPAPSPSPAAPTLSVIVGQTPQPQPRSWLPVVLALGAGAAAVGAWYMLSSKGEKPTPPPRSRTVPALDDYEPHETASESTARDSVDRDLARQLSRAGRDMQKTGFLDFGDLDADRDRYDYADEPTLPNAYKTCPKCGKGVRADATECWKCGLIFDTGTGGSVFGRAARGGFGTAVRNKGRRRRNCCP